MQELVRGRIEQQLQECSGLSIPDYTVLAVLSEAPDGRIRAYELSAMIGWEKSRLHHQLTRMCRRGLVTRLSGAGRAVNVEITAHGRSTLEAAAPNHSAHVRCMVIDPLTPEQIDQLGDISTAILAGLTRPQ